MNARLIHINYPWLDLRREWEFIPKVLGLDIVWITRTNLAISMFARGVTKTEVGS